MMHGALYYALKFVTINQNERSLSMAEQTERVVKNIPVSEDLHSKAKNYASEHGMTMSGLTTRAIIEYLDKRVKNFCPKSCTVHDSSTPHN